ncbi:gas vesicle protein GvpN [Vacuolonema iberomarrocanum]|uniref:gas vesicle protein GvpN n=1 Tax=Vacuolonema iberomarrocanum TaxID=3454632 RepID=UPI001A03136D|nr:gas vesicle protein GvpN [filamentous cyanobacterium LEGE 07170]
MTTVLQARPRRFVSTPSVERVSTRSLRYLQSGYSVHLRGPAGTGKTTLALHLADLLGRPIMLLFGDDEFKTSDLIGNQSGYTRKKVVDNFIHSVVKVEDELRHNWVDSRLTMACREGFTLVYDEFNRSRPEVNNVLLAALEEKLLVLPPSNNRPEYIRVNPHFRAIFTSNPEEYCGVHGTQDALLDRLITINMPEPDELTQQEIAVQKSGLDRHSANLVVSLVKAFRNHIGAEKSSGLRSCLMIAKVCQEHDIMVTPENAEFRDICQDVLLSRSGLPDQEATRLLWEVFNDLICQQANESDAAIALSVDDLDDLGLDTGDATTETEVGSDAFLAETVRALQESETPEAGAPASETVPDAEPSQAKAEAAIAEDGTIEPPSSQADAQNLDVDAVHQYMLKHPNARPSQIQAELEISRVRIIDALHILQESGAIAAPRSTPAASTTTATEE